MPGSVLFVGRRCGDEVGGCAEQRLLQRLDALGEGGVLGREGDSIRDTALLHEGLQLSTRLLSRIRPRLLGVDAAKQICPALRDRRLSVIGDPAVLLFRSEEHTTKLQSLMRISYAVFCLKKKKIQQIEYTISHISSSHKHTTH